MVRFIPGPLVGHEPCTARASAPTVHLTQLSGHHIPCTIVMCMCVLDYASVVCMGGANGKTALATLINPPISMFSHLSVVCIYIYM